MLMPFRVERTAIPAHREYRGIHLRNEHLPGDTQRLAHLPDFMLVCKEDIGIIDDGTQLLLVVPEYVLPRIERDKLAPLRHLAVEDRDLQ